MSQASTGMGKLGTNKIIHLNIFLTVLRKNLKVEETDFLKISKGKGFSFGNWLLYLTFFWLKSLSVRMEDIRREVQK